MEYDVPEVKEEAKKVVEQPITKPLRQRKITKPRLKIERLHTKEKIKRTN